MLTRREKLLIRPWQLRRYNNHRKKVLTALPAIDFGPPPERGHVSCKLKKLQSEDERRSQIEEDNFRLLQRMGEIMKKNRLDNHWKTQQPNFLHRVGIYHRTRSSSPYQEMSSEIKPDGKLTRKIRCLACTPIKVDLPKVPEDRIPWEPPRGRLSRRRSDPSTPPLSSDFDIPRSYNSPFQTYHKMEQNLNTIHPVSAGSKYTRGKSSSSVESQDYRQSKLTEYTSTSSKRSRSTSVPSETRRLTVKQGVLELALELPSFAEIRLNDADDVKYLLRGHCQCKSFQTGKIY